LDECNSGCVYSVDIDEAGLPIRFVNSGVPQLAEFLLIVRGTPTESSPKRYTDAEAKAYTEELTQKFRNADPEAMHDEDGYWPGYLRATLI